MLVFESGDTLEEQVAQIIVEQIVQCLHTHNVSVEIAKYLLDQTKVQAEMAKV